MYLFVWIDGTSRIVIDNITVADMMGVRVGTLNVFRIRRIFNKTATVWELKVYKLIFDEEKIVWVPVHPSKSITSNEVKLHVP